MFVFTAVLRSLVDPFVSRETPRFPDLKTYVAQVVDIYKDSFKALPFPCTLFVDFCVIMQIRTE